MTRWPARQNLPITNNRLTVLFDIGFWELGVIGVVALMVIGPERLPAVARTAGLWVGRVRRIATGFREDLEQEFRADELKRSLIDQHKSLLDPIRQVGDELRATINESVAEGSQSRSDQKKVEPASVTTSSVPSSTKVIDNG